MAAATSLPNVLLVAMVTHNFIHDAYRLTITSVSKSRADRGGGATLKKAKGPGKPPKYPFNVLSFYYFFYLFITFLSF